MGPCRAERGPCAKGKVLPTEQVRQKGSIADKRSRTWAKAVKWILLSNDCGGESAAF